MPKKGSILQDVRIIGLVEGGDALGRHIDSEGTSLDIHLDPRTVAPSDVAAVRILGKRNRLWQGRVEAITAPSPQRVEPACPHFGTCGGCGLQHWPYEVQLNAKDALVRSCLAPFSAESTWHPIMGCAEQWDFRNKMEYTASARSWQEKPAPSGSAVPVPPAFGLFVPFSGNKVLDIRSCRLQDSLGDRIRNWWRDYASDKGLPAYHSTSHQGWLRTLLVRITSTGQSLVLFIVAAPAPEQGPAEALEAMAADFRRAFPEVTSVWTLVNPKLNDSYADLVPSLAAGEPEIEERIDGLRFMIGPQTFFQVNSRQTVRLYSRIVELAGLKPEQTVYDLYCGVGSISACLARHARRVIGIEYMESSIAAARRNAALNGQENLEFLTGDMKDLLVPALFERLGAPDLVVTDPPRAGMHPKACETLAASEAQRIVYVSCNPASLARDLAILVPRYRLTAVQAVDLMPHSHHIETIAVLERHGSQP